MDGKFANANISYLFDDKIKKVLDNVPEEADDYLHGRDPYYLNIGGKMLREHIRQNQNKITRTEHRNLNNADYLAFAIMYCSDYDKYNNLDELNEDLSNPYEQNFIEPLYKIDSGNDTEFTTTCACMKGIEDVYYYQNPDTGKGFLMGNHCIETGFILNEQEKKEMNGAFTIECKRCGNKTYKTHSQGNAKNSRCSRCDKDKRRCEKCGLFKVKKDAPDWKKQCLDCYRDSKDSLKGTCFINLKN